MATSKKIAACIVLAISISVICGCLFGVACASGRTVLGHCTRVECGGFTDYICRDKVVKSETGTHKYGVLLQNTCAVNYEYCYSDLKCYGCGTIYEYQVGPHDCYERHYNCGTGLYHVCPCAGAAWPDD